MSDRELKNNNDEQWLNEFVIHPNDPTGTIQVTTPTYDVNLPTLSPSATTESQQSKQKHNLSPATAEYYFKLGPHPLELRQVSPTREYAQSPTLSKKGLTKLLKPYDLADTPPPPNDPELPNVKAVMN